MGFIILMNLIIIPVQTPNFCSSRSPPSWPSRAWWPAGPAHPRATRSPPLLGPAKICPGVPVFGTCTAPTLGAGPKTKSRRVSIYCGEASSVLLTANYGQPTVEITARKLETHCDGRNMKRTVNCECSQRRPRSM